MDTLPERASRALTLAAGLLTIFALLPAGMTVSGGGTSVVQYQFMIALLAAGLITAAFAPAIRPTMVGAGVLVKAGMIAIALSTSGLNPSLRLDAVIPDVLSILLLIGAAVFMLMTARQEARWEGRSVGRRESYARTAG